MANPVFSKPLFNTQSTSTLTPSSPGITTPTDAASLQAAWDAGTATAYHTGRMTYDDVIVRTGGLLGLVVLGGVIGWWQSALVVPAVVIALVLGLVNAFKREPSPVLMIAYAAIEGVALGGISRAFNVMAHGAVLQAVVATIATFIAILLLFSSGKVRATPKMTRFVFAAMLGYFFFSLVNMVLVWTGVLPDFGLRSVSVLGIPLGLLVSVLAVLLAAYALLADFEAIKQGVNKGIDRRYAWTAAYGLTVTLIWLYIEFLRILSYFRD
jgi:uncharacterized YccA/Bax inhibitor family protein